MNHEALGKHAASTTGEVIRALSMSGFLGTFRNTRGWHRQGWPISLGLLSLLVLTAIGVYLSSEAFDGDMEAGFNDAVLLSRDPDSPSRSGGTLLQPKPTPLTTCVRGTHVKLLLEETARGARQAPCSDPQIGRLVASRSCARSRLNPESGAIQSPDTPLDCANAPPADSPSRAGCFFRSQPIPERVRRMRRVALAGCGL